MARDHGTGAAHVAYALYDALREFVACAGPQHADGCPGDDTCDCAGKSANDKVNAAMNLCEQEGLHLDSLLARHDERVERLEAVAAAARALVSQCFECGGTGTYDIDNEPWEAKWDRGNGPPPTSCACTPMREALAALEKASGHVGSDEVRAMLADPALSPREIVERVREANAPSCVDCGAKLLLVVAVCAKCPFRKNPEELSGRCGDCHRKHDIVVHGGAPA